jgi:hypothetical protein
MIDKYFQLREKQTTVQIEFIAGLTTFLTMAYIIFVNPNILSAAGMDKQALIIVPCIYYNDDDCSKLQYQYGFGFWVYLVHPYKNSIG